MTRQFDEEDAQKYGVDEAIVLWHIRYIQRDNEANGQCFRDGRTWVKASMISLSLQMPFYSIRAIDRILRSLVKQNALQKLGGPGFANEDILDRTSWYSVEVPFTGTGKWVDKTILQVYEGNSEQRRHYLCSRQLG